MKNTSTNKEVIMIMLIHITQTSILCIVCDVTWVSNKPGVCLLIKHWYMLLVMSVTHLFKQDNIFLAIHTFFATFN